MTTVILLVLTLAVVFLVFRELRRGPIYTGSKPGQSKPRDWLLAFRAWLGVAIGSIATCWADWAQSISSNWTTFVAPVLQSQGNVTLLVAGGLLVSLIAGVGVFLHQKATDARDPEKVPEAPKNPEAK